MLSLLGRFSISSFRSDFLLLAFGLERLENCVKYLIFHALLIVLNEIIVYESIGFEYLGGIIFNFIYYFGLTVHFCLLLKAARILPSALLLIHDFNLVGVRSERI